MTNKIARQATVFFSEGALGGLTNSLTVWLFGQLWITSALGVNIAPALTPNWLYPRIVWGGLWGVLFFLPILKNHPLSKGLVLSLGPTLAIVSSVSRESETGNDGVGVGDVNPYLWYCLMPCGESQQLTG
ncbi:hypothetical protein [Phormidium sp. CCY1219]|uniref:hypothetical protein n=1 Tax=Phormidium sp. CCY1219 TaxID=2886104 RepID=UPI002D1E6D6D|nr:hypothetical protein [Phormidium sp. CCY1219]MEB3828705.1 hypothetical protein [Phormidium sp. CCY1219]